MTSKLTKTQRRVLRRVDDETFYLYNQCASRRTILRKLWFRGFVRHVGVSSPIYFKWVLTEKGRKAAQP